MIQRKNPEIRRIELDPHRQCDPVLLIPPFVDPIAPTIVLNINLDNVKQIGFD